MGAKNPDRVASPPSPSAALSLAEIHIRQWELMAYCPTCRTRLKANLPTMIKVFGPDVIWWGQRPPCPGWDCGGRLLYSARAVRGGTWVSMERDPPSEYVEAWRFKRRLKDDDRGPR